MIKKVSLLLGLLLSTHLFADSRVDLYGDNSLQATALLNKYGKAIQESSEQMFKAAAVDIALQAEQKNRNVSPKRNSELEKSYNIRVQLAERIKKEGNYDFVDIQTVNYPENQGLYTTIEVIKKTDKQRLKFLTPKNARNSAKKEIKDDIIEKRITFNHIEAELIINNKVKVKDIYCPVYHCVTGFKHPKLKPYLSVFNKAAINEKTLILNTLKNDPDLERREAAVFLIGHFKDPNEIITVLTPYINDPHDSVRNNVMRTIGATLEKSACVMDPMPLIHMLDSPYETDRNKALYSLIMLNKNKNIKQVLVKNASPQLLAMLKLKQPNNHDEVYKLLLDISGKHFGDRDIAAWEKWLSIQNEAA